MTGEEIGQALLELRSEVCVLYAREAMARVEVDAGFNELLGRIDHLATRAAGIDLAELEQRLLDSARELRLEVHAIDKHKGRIFGQVFALNAFGLLINTRRGWACVVPNDDVVGDQGNATVGKPALVQYFHGKCQIAFQNLDAPTGAVR
jgi:hypothetical protein